MIGAWLHDIDPFLVHINDQFVRWYGMSYLAGFVAGYLLWRFLARRGASLVPADRMLDAVLMIAVGAVAGGRLGYVVFYEPTLLGLVDGFPYWGVLAINRGGMASHGGIIGTIIAAWLISRGFKDESGVRVGRCSRLHVMDLLALGAPAGLFFGRIANFINGELLGRVVAKPGEPGPWWAVRYPQEVLERGRNELLRSPEQWEAIERLGASHALPSEQMFREWVPGYQRVLAKVQFGDADLRAQLEPLISARYPSQLIQALAEGVVLGLVIWIVARRARKPGVVGCWFLIVYGLGRIATEFVRLADAHLVTPRLGGLSRGQWLSTAMVLAGVVALWIIGRSKAERVGGWGSKETSRRGVV